MNLFDILLAKNLSGQNTYSKAEINALLDEKLDKSGGAVTGQITTNQTEFTASNQLITKGYVDTIVGDINTVLEEVL